MKTIWLRVLLLLWIYPGGRDLTLSLTDGLQWSSRVIGTKYGGVRGFLLMPGGGYEGLEIFLGLPYASPPLGSLRLMPPVSGAPWTGTRISSDLPPACPQRTPDITPQAEADRLAEMPRGRLATLRRLIPMLANQSEDCLYLNIYVPLTVSSGGNGGKLLPVMVFVHGDDFGWGGGAPYDPSMLSSQGNLIVITINYRLGILGFLNANSDGYFKSPANFALLDQIAALHWVQENIGAFGGDRSNVTLMGHGKGAILVNYLMISSAVPPGVLFQRGILLSGSSLGPRGGGGGREAARKFATSVQCPTEPPSTMLHCLRQVPLQSFIESPLWGDFGPSEDGVTVEGGDGNREVVLRDRLGRYPLLWGTTRAEALPKLPDHDASYGLETERRREILRNFVEKHFSVHRNEILAAAIHEYTDWERPVQHPISVRDETLDALADAQVVAPLVKMGDLHSQSNLKSYFCVFDYQSKSSDYQQRLGCVHGEELLYIFGAPLFFSSPEVLAAHSNDPTELRLGFFAGNFTRNEITISQTIMMYFANFIRTGNPNDGLSDGSSDEAGRFHSEKSGGKSSKIVEWPAYDPLYKKYLTFDTKPKIRTHYRAHKLSFWLHLVPDLLKNGYNVGPSHHGVHGGPPNSSNGTNEDSPISPTGPPPPPDLQFVGVPTWEQQSPSASKGISNSSPPNVYGKGELGGGDGSDGDGFQIYSTALSVTIAIGCSLLILNILIFAAFYYQRDKRRCEQNSHQHSSQYDSSQEGSLELRGGGQSMANICGDPAFLQHHSDGQSEFSQQQQQQGHQSILKRQNRASATQQQQQQQQQLQQQQQNQQNFDMSMPDAILAAAMANMNYSPTYCGPGASGSLESSPGDFRSRTFQRRLSLTGQNQTQNQPKDSQQQQQQQTQYMQNQQNQHATGCKTVPRPPKRSTPNVKFNLSDTSDGSTGGQQQQSQTLKPSLKKYTQSSNQQQTSPFEDLRV